MYSLNHYFLGFGSRGILHPSLRPLFFFSPSTWSCHGQCPGTKSSLTQSSGAVSGTKFGLSGNKDQKLPALVLSGRFSTCLKDGIFQRQEGAKAELHGRVAAVENMLPPAFVHGAGKNEYLRVMGREWQYISKSAWVLKERKIRYMDGF